MLRCEAGLLAEVLCVRTGAVGLLCAGAMDCTVVSVVVIDRTDGAGEENVLSLPPSVFGAVALVPAPEGAASDMAVSACVANVGALDLVNVWLS